MIIIGEKYGIKADGNGYMLVKAAQAESDQKDKKGKIIRRAGETYWVTMESYHPTVSGCIDSLIRKLQRAEVADNEMNLEEARERFEFIENTVRMFAREP